MLAYFIITYIGIGILSALFVFGSHLRACFEYFRQLYTSKEVRPSQIKTYFGTQFWEYSDNDNWTEIIVMTTLPAILFSFIAFVGWPLGSIFIINNSINKARERIEND